MNVNMEGMESIVVSRFFEQKVQKKCVYLKYFFCNEKVFIVAYIYKYMYIM